VRAYNDKAGVTAQFNLNLLNRMNRELGSDFSVDNFLHRAVYNDTLGRVEMHLASQKDHEVRINGDKFTLEKDEIIHTESSYKYTIPEFQATAQRAGFTPIRAWTDQQNLFSCQYFTV